MLQYGLGGLVRHLGTALYAHVGTAFLALACVLATLIAAHRTRIGWLRRPAWLLAAAAPGASAVGRGWLGDEIWIRSLGLCGGRTLPSPNHSADVAHGRRDAAGHALDQLVPTSHANRVVPPRRGPAARACGHVRRGVRTCVQRDGAASFGGEPAMTVQSAPTYSTSASTCVAAPATCVAVETAPAEELALGRLAIGLRLSDYLELAKPRIAAMVLLTVLVGYTLGGRRLESCAGLPDAARHRAGGRSQRGVQSADRAADRCADGADGQSAAADRSSAAGEVALFGVACAAVGLSLLYLKSTRRRLCSPP